MGLERIHGGRDVLDPRFPVRLHRVVRVEVHARDESREPRGDRTAMDNVSTIASALPGASPRRLAATVRHARRDRIPIDLGSTGVTGIHVGCVAQLRD